MAISENRIGAVKGYTVYQIGLHWLIAVLVVTQLIFGESMSEAIEAIEAAKDGETVSALNSYLAGTHFYFGIAILALVAVRLALRIRNAAPPPPSSSGAVELAGKISHWLFYALLVIVPVTGLLGYYFGDPYGELHTYAKPVFVGLIALHAAAALYHQFWLKDGLLMRMLTPR
jgi:cytochrome b561